MSKTNNKKMEQNQLRSNKMRFKQQIHLCCMISAHKYYRRFKNMTFESCFSESSPSFEKKITQLCMLLI